MNLLLEFEKVSRRDVNGDRQRLLLDQVDFGLDGGEQVGVIGQRRSGRTTLIRVAAGLDAPHEGVARFDGESLAGRRPPALGRGIGLAHLDFGPGGSKPVVEHVAWGLHILRIPLDVSRHRAWEALGRVGAETHGQHRPSDLKAGGRIRVAIARALVSRPRLLLLDDPMDGVTLSERDSLIQLVRSFKDEGIAVLFTASEAAELAGADRVLKLDRGKLRGGSLFPSESGDVVRLDTRASG